MNQGRGANGRGVLLLLILAVAVIPPTGLWPPPRMAGFSCDGQACNPVEVDSAYTPPAGFSRAGVIDLTGDGIPERVRMEGDRVAIYRDDVEVWRSPPEWQVVDLALGDPNDDGRGEVLLAFWKPDTTGVLRSHPFIIGYREGVYRALWGGSAVQDPIREVVLADVDGDNVQELVVLEEQGAGAARAVAVWRWYGWGFGLMWRSTPGRYRDLDVIPGEGGYQPVICVTAEPRGPSLVPAWLSWSRMLVDGGQPR